MDREALHRQQYIRQLYEQEGWGCARIGRELGLTRQRVFQVKEQMRLKRPGDMSIEQRMAKIEALMRDGHTQRRIAKVLHVSREVVSQTLAKHPERQAILQAWREAQPVWKRRREIPALIENGLTGTQIAKRLCVSQAMIACDFKALNLSADLQAKVRENARVATGSSVASRNRGRAER